eukprot:SM000023S07582  [mRNA]  locus=s23:224001:225763:- [translate_table: standard]
MVGLDDALDAEAEEDEFDQVAVGARTDGERVYMREAYGGEGERQLLEDAATGTSIAVAPAAAVSAAAEEPGGRHDPRADRGAAAARLEEDEAEAAAAYVEAGPAPTKGGGSMGADEGPDPLPVPDTAPPCGHAEVDLAATSPQVVNNGEGLQSDESGRPQHAESEPTEAQALVSGRGGLARPGSAKRPRRTVRFSVEEGHGSGEAAAAAQPAAATKLPPRPPRRASGPSQVPDHVRHPEKYTYYSLDWTEDDGPGASATNGQEGSEEESAANHSALAAALAAARSHLPSPGATPPVAAGGGDATAEAPRPHFVRPSLPPVVGSCAPAFVNDEVGRVSLGGRTRGGRLGPSPRSARAALDGHDQPTGEAAGSSAAAPAEPGQPGSRVVVAATQKDDEGLPVEDDDTLPDLEEAATSDATDKGLAGANGVAFVAAARPGAKQSRKYRPRRASEPLQNGSTMEVDE